MTKEEDKLELSLFGQKHIRRIWHKEEWYYSIIDVVAFLTDSTDPRKYWAAVKARRVIEEDIGRSIVTTDNHMNPKKIKEKPKKSANLPLFDRLDDSDKDNS